MVKDLLTGAMSRWRAERDGAIASRTYANGSYVLLRADGKSGLRRSTHATAPATGSRFALNVHFRREPTTFDLEARRNVTLRGEPGISL